MPSKSKHQPDLSMPPPMSSAKACALRAARRSWLRFPSFLMASTLSSFESRCQFSMDVSLPSRVTITGPSLSRSTGAPSTISVRMPSQDRPEASNISALGSIGRESPGGLVEPFASRCVPRTRTQRVLDTKLDARHTVRSRVVSVSASWAILRAADSIFHRTLRRRGD